MSKLAASLTHQVFDIYDTDTAARVGIMSVENTPEDDWFHTLFQPVEGAPVYDVISAQNMTAEQAAVMAAERATRG